MVSTIFWFRNDLRVIDNPGLIAAQRRKLPVVPIYIWAPQEDGQWPLGPTSRSWLCASLMSLHNDLKKLNANLVIREGNTLDVLRLLICETGASAIFWNDCYEPQARARDNFLKEALTKLGMEIQSFNAVLLKEPGSVLNQQGKPYQVFTSFCKNYLAEDYRFISVNQEPKIFRTVQTWPLSLSVKELGLCERRAWPDGTGQNWQPGSQGAQRRLAVFLNGVIDAYATDRDRPDQRGVSYLSPHLHFGEIGPKQIFSAVLESFDALKESERAPLRQTKNVYLSELVWREFAYHLLYHYPHTADLPLREQFRRFSWSSNKKLLQAWQEGLTGYPIVDAGMRELLATGWMHNRVRMIVASFLVKDLMVDWLAGAKWFWQNLADADLANNTFNWQWVAGCGADAAPYFRIFNPLAQSRRFDAKGDYIRRWVPELAKLPAPAIYAPWKLSEDQLQAAGIRLSKNYPKPIVDHLRARARALAAFSSLQSESKITH